MASGITTQKENLCKDPKAAVDQLNAMAAKFGGGKILFDFLIDQVKLTWDAGASAAKGTKGPGGSTRRFRV